MSETVRVYVCVSAWVVGREMTVAMLRVYVCGSQGWGSINAIQPSETPCPWACGLCESVCLGRQKACGAPYSCGLDHNWCEDLTRCMTLPFDPAHMHTDNIGHNLQQVKNRQI